MTATAPTFSLLTTFAVAVFLLGCNPDLIPASKFASQSADIDAATNNDQSAPSTPADATTNIGPIGPPTAWSFESVATVAAPDGALSVAIGTKNAVHVAFYTSDKDLYHATNASGSWLTAVVESGTDVGDRNSIGVHGDGTIHVSYRDYDKNLLRHAVRKPAGAWKHVTLAEKGGLGGFENDLALDASGHVHITYYNSSESRLEYLSDSGGDWATEVLDDKYDAGSVNAVAVTPDGKTLHAAHVAYKTKKLVWLRRGASGIERVEIDSKSVPGEQIDLAIDGGGAAHIAYYDTADKDLRYATNKTGAWQVMAVDVEGDLGDHLGIATGPSGVPHIAYRGYDPGVFRHARLAGPVWKRVELSKSSLGKGVDVEVGDDGTVHVVFANWDDKNLRHATAPP